MSATRVIMHQIVLPSEVDLMGICFGGQVDADRLPFLCINAASRLQMSIRQIGIGILIMHPSCKLSCEQTPS